MVACREPLSLDFVIRIFSIKRDTPSAKRNAVLAMNCISLLFVIKENRVSFFHRSVKDWLVSEKDHIYKIDENYGHFTLAKLCAECFDNILKSTDLDMTKLTDLEMYAVCNGFYHMIKDKANIVSHANSYLKNFELVFRCLILVDYYETWLGELIDVLQYNRYNSKLNELYSNFEYIFEVTSYFFVHKFNEFLQVLIIEALGEISSKAIEFHTRYFSNLPYFENVSKHNEKAKKETIDLFSKEEEYSSAKQSSELSLVEKTSESFTEENNLGSADVRNLFDYVVLCFEPDCVVMLISIKPFKVMWKKTFPKEEISCSCIAFHPHHDVILPGRLDKVLSLTEGLWQPGPFVCEKNYFFSDCCFSPDNNIMITGNYSDEHLILWDLVSGEKKRRIEVGGHVYSFSFSSNGNYLAVLKNCKRSDGDNFRRIYWSVFDVVKNYTQLYESDRTDFSVTEKVSLTASKSDLWIVSLEFSKFSEFCYNGEVMTDESGDYPEVGKQQIFFPPATKSHETIDRSIASQIMPNFRYFRLLSFVCEPLPFYLINLRDDLNLSISRDYALTLEVNRLTSGNISFDGRYFYQHSQSSRQLRVLKRDGKCWIFLNEKVHQGVIAFAVVINGVFIVTAQSIVEMWDIEMTQRLMYSQQMAAIECCESVSDDVIACVGKTEVSFINSHNLQVISTTLVSENQLVLACSSKCDVLVKDIRFENSECFIMRNNKKILSLGNTDIFIAARFSPNAKKLVLLDARYEHGYRCYDISESSVTTVSQMKYLTFEMLCFLDNEYYITVRGSKSLFLNSIHLSNKPSKVVLKQHATSLFYCRATQTLIVNYTNNNFREFQVKWPRK